MKYLLITLLSAISLTCGAQSLTLVYSHPADTLFLEMDIYLPDVPREDHACILYIYGGGFSQGTKDGDNVHKFCKEMSARGYVVAANNYRLGMKGVQFTTPLGMVDKAENAIRMATEDCSAAVAFLLSHSEEYAINKERIILCGSSAGAITALQTDYCLANGSEWTSALPSDFRFAGIVSYSGAVFTREAPLRYSREPAPTLLVHGTNDRIVVYGSLRFFNLGLIGSNVIAQTFKRNSWPVNFVKYKGLSHDVAAFHNRTYELLDAFVSEFVTDKKVLYSERTVIPDNYKIPDWATVSTKDIY